MSIDRLPALPLIANDPYFSIWLPGDTLTDARPVHWSGEVKDMTGVAEIDGRRYRFLSGRVNIPAMKTTALRVTPTATISVMEAAGVELTVTFQTPRCRTIWTRSPPPSPLCASPRAPWTEGRTRSPCA